MNAWRGLALAFLKGFGRRQDLKGFVFLILWISFWASWAFFKRVCGLGCHVIAFACFWAWVFRSWHGLTSHWLHLRKELPPSQTSKSLLQGSKVVIDLDGFKT